MFKLLIECTKDIDRISIDFTDGTSVIKESNKESQETTQEITQETTEKTTKENYKESHKETFQNNDIDTSKYKKKQKSTVNIKDVEIPDVDNRPAKIDENLNGLDF